MAEESKRIRRPSRKVLEAISDGLDEIEARFDLSGFSTRLVEPIEEKPLSKDTAQISDGGEEGEDDIQRKTTVVKITAANTSTARKLKWRSMRSSRH